MTEMKTNILSEMPPRNPTNGTFELTVRCNLRCKMCLFRHRDSENEEIRKNELTAKQWIQLAEDVANAGTFTLLITGGEPFLREDFCEIWEGIYKQGFIITLYTNATLLTPKIMETLRKYPPHTIGVTLYGASPETYEKVCGNANAFEKAINGIKQLKTLPSIMEYRTTIIQDNVHEIDEMENLVRNEFDGFLTQTRMVFQSVRGACADVNTCRLEPEDNVRLVYRREIDQIKKKVGASYDEKNLAFERKEKECEIDSKTNPQFTLFGCNAGMSSYVITWNGKLIGCQILGAFQTDVKELGFDKAWQEYPFTVKIPPLNEKCQKCEIIEHCGSCFATRYAESKSLGGCPEYACKDAKFINDLLSRKDKIKEINK